MARQLDGLDGPLVGVRHQVHDEADPEWLLQEKVQRGRLLASEYGDALAIVGDDPDVLAGTAIRTYGLALP